MYSPSPAADEHCRCPITNVTAKTNKESLVLYQNVLKMCNKVEQHSKAAIKK